MNRESSIFLMFVCFFEAVREVELKAKAKEGWMGHGQVLESSEIVVGSGRTPTDCCRLHEPRLPGAALENLQTCSTFSDSLLLAGQPIGFSSILKQLSTSK